MIILDLTPTPIVAALLPTLEQSADARVERCERTNVTRVTLRPGTWGASAARALVSHSTGALVTLRTGGVRTSVRTDSFDVAQREHDRRVLEHQLKQRELLAARHRLVDLTTALRSASDAALPSLARDILSLEGVSEEQRATLLHALAVRVAAMR